MTKIKKSKEQKREKKAAAKEREKKAEELGRAAAVRADQLSIDLTKILDELDER